MLGRKIPKKPNSKSFNHIFIGNFVIPISGKVVRSYIQQRSWNTVNSEENGS